MHAGARRALDSVKLQEALLRVQYFYLSCRAAHNHNAKAFLLRMLLLQSPTLAALLGSVVLLWKGSLEQMPVGS